MRTEIKVWKDSVGFPFYANFNKDLTGLVDQKMYLMNPDGTESEQTDVTVEGTKLKWLSGSGDFADVGTYRLQPWIDDGVFSGRREPIEFDVVEDQREVLP